MNLLPDIIRYIAIYLNFETFAEYRLTCSKIHRALKDDFFFRIFWECERVNKNPILLAIRKGSINLLRYCDIAKYTYLGKVFNEDIVMIPPIENLKTITIPQRSIGPTIAIWLIDRNYQINLDCFDATAIYMLLKSNKICKDTAKMYIDKNWDSPDLFPIMELIGISQFLVPALEREKLDIVRKIYDAGGQVTDRVTLRKFIFKIRNPELFYLLCERSKPDISDIFIPVFLMESLCSERLKILITFNMPKLNLMGLFPESIERLRRLGYNPEIEKNKS